MGRRRAVNQQVLENMGELLFDIEDEAGKLAERAQTLRSRLAQVLALQRLIATAPTQEDKP